MWIDRSRAKSTPKCQGERWAALNRRLRTKMGTKGITSEEKQPTFRHNGTVLPTSTQGKEISRSGVAYDQGFRQQRIADTTRAKGKATVEPAQLPEGPEFNKSLVAEQSMASIRRRIENKGIYKSPKRLEFYETLVTGQCWPLFDAVSKNLYYNCHLRHQHRASMTPICFI